MRRPPFLCVLLLLAAPGCEERAPAPAAAALPPGASVALTPALREEGRALYESRCATCHGASGAGDGPAGAGLVPRPRDLRDAVWQQRVTDAHLDRVITGGGLAVGQSALMPPSPDLRGRPELAALRAHVRALSAGTAQQPAPKR